MPAPPCPSHDTLASLVANALPELDQQSVRDHLGSCTRCTEAFVELERQRSSMSMGLSPEAARFDFLAPAQHEDEMGRLGPYRVLRLLGEGGMGMVFLAEETELERLVALKVMKSGESSNDTSRQRFLQEGKVVAKIQHDHIITVYRVGEEGTTPYLAMQYLEGEPLDKRVKREGPLPMADALRIGREMAEGLSAAHASGLIHRDIKPANIWLEAPRGRVKILDFGLARAISGATSLTQSGMVVGTPDFMAPEQARGQQLDDRCDIFSLGCVLYFMCTGRKPFQGDDMLATLVAVANEQPFPIREINPAVPWELADRIAGMMSKHPNDRPRSMQAVIDELKHIEHALEHGATTTQQRRVGDPTRETTRRRTVPGSQEATRSGPADRPARKPAATPRPMPTPTKRKLEDIGLTPADSMALGTPLEATNLDITPVSPSSPTKPLEKRKPEMRRPAPIVNRPANRPPPASTTPVESSSGTNACPNCKSTRLSSVGWCLACGYSPSTGVKGTAAPSSLVPVSNAYVYALFAGVILIAFNTMLGYYLFQRGTRSWSNFVTAQMYAGLGMFTLAHLWAYMIAYPFHDNSRTPLPLITTPTRVWWLTYKLMPRTRQPLVVFGWSLTAVCGALLLAGNVGFFFGAPGSLDMSLDELPIAMITKDRSETATPTSMRATVIGYVKRDQQIAAIILAERTSDDKLKYVGLTSALGSEARKEAPLISRKLIILSTSTPPVPGVDVENAVWVEPELTCKVDFAGRDINGILEDAVIVTWNPKPKK